MGEIKLLDCTLRDGGYINDWRFGEEKIPEMIENLEKSKVDILEIGFLKNEPYQKDRTVFNSMEQVKTRIPEKKPGTEYAVMCEVVNPLPLEMLAPADADGADIIRVIVWKTKRNADGVEIDALQEGYEYCEGIVKKGYKLCVQPARVSQYSDDEFVSMVKRFSKLSPMAIYVVDSWGTENAERLLHYMHLADENMPEEIALGYHGHNNMMQALGVSQAMLKEGFQRDVMIDASVYGIGRGAGNLNLEIIAKYLNEEFVKDYNISPMLKVYSKNISEIYQKEKWGFSIPYFLTAQYNCNPAYAKNYADVPFDDISEILRNLSKEDRVIYHEKTAKQYLDKQMQKKNIAVIMLVQNDGKAVDKWILNVVESFYKNKIDIFVYDMGDDRKTENYVKNYILDGYKNVFYKRIEITNSSINRIEIMRSIYRELSKEYSYLWMHDSEFLLNIDNIIGKIEKSTQKHADVIVVTPTWRERQGIEDATYRDVNKLFQDKCKQMCSLGTVILSAHIAKKIAELPVRDDTVEVGIWQMEAIFRYIAEKNVVVDSYVGLQWSYNTATSAERYNSYDAIKIWCQQWYQCIRNLPEKYENIKNSVYKTEREDYHPFYVHALLEMRANGMLTVKKVNENREIIPIICNTSLNKFYLVARIPRNIAAFLTNSKNSKLVTCIKGIYYIICGFVPGEKERL